MDNLFQDKTCLFSFIWLTQIYQLQFKNKIIIADQFLKDRSENLTGKISEFGGKLWIFDAKGNRLGQYNPDINVTFDAIGNRIGSGNLLTMLLK
jgi:hypothetical protein